MAIIQAWAGGRFLNHSFATGEVNAEINAYLAETGAYDGELWNFVDAGNGNVFIQGVSGGRYLNHSYASGEVSASIEKYDHATGAYDGTLWKFVDAGGGNVFIQGVSGGRYLNHSYASGEVSASIEKYDPATGAYDGTLWRVITACHLVSNAKPGNNTKIRNASGVNATVKIGQLTVDFPPGSEIEMSPNNAASNIEITNFIVTPFVPLVKLGQVTIEFNSDQPGSEDATKNWRLVPGGGFKLQE